MATTGVVIAQTTIDDEDAARRLARGAVEARLAACSHVDAPIQATYWWKGGLETATEWRISFKTPRERLEALSEWVHREHSYDVPEWIVLPVEGGSEAYLEWVARETGPRP
ncbi:divalent-cation tolerance protein CutA [Streptomyces polychromogenes]|uniref:Divalent-cation tolerance protein CutA n=1 Tax=Streptomyces polychromogenes TaxID=67342 RepID=A0ABN0V335_9ACTN